MQGPETHRVLYMEVGLKFCEFLNNNQTWYFKKQDLKQFFPVIICPIKGVIMDQNSMGILCGDIHSSSVKSVFYTETAGAAWPSVTEVFDNQMHTLQHGASEIKWQEARGCHKQN